MTTHDILEIEEAVKGNTAAKKKLSKMLDHIEELECFESLVRESRPNIDEEIDDMILNKCDRIVSSFDTGGGQ